MTAAPAILGVRFEGARPPAEASPLRSDIAGFLCRTRRGPVGCPRRVEGWPEFMRVFGGLDRRTDDAHAVRGYFENGGQVAHIVRLAGDGAAPACGRLDVSDADAAGAVPPGFAGARYRIEATSPGDWANGGIVVVRYEQRGVSGGPELRVEVRVSDEPAEMLGPIRLAAQVDDQGRPRASIDLGSDLVRFDAENPGSIPRLAAGPQRCEWTVVLSGGHDPAPGLAQYRSCLGATGRPRCPRHPGDGSRTRASTLGDEPEVAMVVAPGLHRDLSDAESVGFAGALLAEAAALQDRLVILDLPGTQDPGRSWAWLEPLRREATPGQLRCGAVYHPRLRVPDPLGDPGATRVIAASGHATGVISRLDRERGAHHTPANATLHEAVALGDERPEPGTVFAAGVNLIRCAPGRGLVVWGGRTLDRRPEGTFLAHRRLVHRLVRAIRRVAEPLVFDVNGPELWFALARAISTVLLEAWRAGALLGTRPEEAFEVVCDEKTNPPEERDLGRVFCTVGVAPAAPMEFIRLVVTLSSSGELEVFES